MKTGATEGTPDREPNDSPESADDPIALRDSRVRLPGLATALAITIPLLLAATLMASDRRFGFSVPLGGACFVVAGVALIHAFGGFSLLAASSDRASRAVPWRRAALFFVALVSLVMALRAAVAGVLPEPVLTSALLVPLTFTWTVLSCFHLLRGLGWFDDGRKLTRRYGFWLVMINAWVFLPLLGSFSLIDPWETHYGEVAREMLARDDWISLWWAQDGFFWSKPILDFWMQGLSFSLLGVEYLPGRMLASVSDGATPHPEWAARIPIYFLTLATSYVLYKAVRQVHGARVGFLAALILTTVPYWYLMSRQSMTDMPYVAPLTACLAFFVLGLASEPEQRLTGRLLVVRGKTIELNAYQLLVLVFLLCALPQVVYLLTRNATLNVATGVLTLHPDTFLAGSGGGNCGALPGNQACRQMQPNNPFVQPALLAVLWSVLLVTLLGLSRRERRVRQICYMAAWLCLALSTMAKGAPGFVIPVFVILIFLGATYRWKEYSRLDPVALALIFVCLALPWYVQMLMRHGAPFSDRLLIHDMYQRAFDHVHDTNAGVDTSIRYYLWQLGYGLFPWSGIAAAGLLYWLGRARDETATTLSRHQASTFFGLWFISAFGLFTVSGTKFHHYILPAVPPLAVLAAVLVDASMGDTTRLRKAPAYFVAMACFAGLALLGLASALGASPFGTRGAFADLGLSGRLLFGGACWLLAVYAHAVATRLAGPRFASAEPVGEPAALSLRPLFGPAAAAGTLLVGLDLARTVDAQLPGQVQLMQLFTYKYERAWPEGLDFSNLLLGFTAFSVVMLLALLVRTLRAHALVAFGMGALVISAWGVNVYLYRAAPHWGQRGNVIAYLKARDSADPPLVAFQMNWKGENFYTGNRLATFVKSGDPFKKWLKEQRAKKLRTIYVTTEHARIKRLKSELGKFKRFTVITSKRDNNKFMVARVDF